MRNFVITSTLTALALVTISTPASAETHTVEVRYADLNLASPAGMATLERRIASAVTKICGKAEVRRLLDGSDHQRCMREAQASASSEIARLTDNGAALALARR